MVHFLGTCRGDAERVLPPITEHLNPEDVGLRVERVEAVRTPGQLGAPAAELPARLVTQAQWLPMQLAAAEALIV